MLEYYIYSCTWYTVSTTYDYNGNTGTGKIVFPITVIETNDRNRWYSRATFRKWKANYNRNSEFGIPVTGNSSQKQTAPEFIFCRNLSEFRKPELENGNYCLWDR